MEDILKILLIEDVDTDAEITFRDIERNGIFFEKLLVDNKKDFLEGLKSFNPDIIISDYSLPRLTGMQALLIRNELAPMTPFILVTGSNNEMVAVDCMKAGADDYILKDNLSRLVPAVVNSISKAKLLREKNDAETALKESDEKFRSIMDNSPDAIFIVDQQGKYLYTNKAVTIMLGFTPEEMQSKTILDISPKDEADKYQKIFMQTVNEGKIFAEIELLKKDGNFISTDLNSVLLPGGMIYGSCRDITERKRSEDAILQERRLLRTLIDNLPDPIYVLDKECRKVIANVADISNIGLKSENEVLGKNDIELFKGEIGIRGQADNEEVIRSGNAIIEREEYFIDKKGIKRWLLTTKIPLRDKDGMITGLVGIGHDITKRKQAESDLKQSHEFSDSLLKTIPFGMDIVDEEGTVLFQSENYKTIFGDSAVGLKCWDLYRDDKIQCENCPLYKGIKIGETEVYESHGVLGNRVFDISHTGMIYHGRKAMLEIFQDITERKKGEEDLIRAKDKAEESDRLKTAFLHNISHEIRTPMNAIVGFSALLGDPDMDFPTRQSYIGMIDQSSNQLLSIIKDILDISNIEANLVKVVKNKFNLNKELKILFEQFKLKSDEKNLKLTCEYGLETEDANIFTDNTKLIQILTNLISNALKFTFTGGISMEYKVLDKYLKFSVTDSGIGIPIEFQEKVFDRFYQVTNAMSRIHEGTGLGLAISKSYVELMGGKIWVMSQPGKGTSVYFTIPYEKNDVPQISETVISVTESFIFSDKKTILIAEDTDSNFILIKYFLSKANTNILRAVNGKEAVEKTLYDKTIDLVLMDIKMPEMDGLTATRIIREVNSTIPIIAQTAYVDDKEMAIESGCSGFISKPFDKKSLFKALREFF